MTFLSKLGKVLATVVNIAGIAAGIGPILNSFIGSKVTSVAGSIVNDLTAIGGIILQVEAILGGGGNGADKLAAATPLIANIVQTSELVSGHKIANESLFIQGCQKVASGVADILNSLSTSNVPDPGKVITVQPLPALPPVVAAPAPSLE